MGERVWMDITNETRRTYILENNERVTIVNPIRVGIKRDLSGQDSHTVHHAGGGAHFPAGSWQAVEWEGETEPAQETFSQRLNAKL